MHARGASEPCQGISRFTAPKDNTKFEILLIRLFSLKQKTKQRLPASINKSNFVSSKKQLYVSSDYIFLFRVNFEISNHVFKETKEYYGEM